MPIKQATRCLMVEGKDDLHSTVHIMKAFIDWPDSKNEAPVQITDAEGISNILDSSKLETFLMQPRLQAAGLIFDADHEQNNRYSKVRDICIPFFPNMPKRMPTEGLITRHNGKRFGIWIMPDNQSPGMLEDFLAELIPSEMSSLWEYTVSCVVEARKRGATCKEAHISKANIHTWLAWHDEPGQTPGIALRSQRVLDPTMNAAKPFVKWFLDLYELKPRAAL